MPDDNVTKQQLELDVQKFITGLRQAQEGLDQFTSNAKQRSQEMSKGFDPVHSALAKLKSGFQDLLAPLTAIGSVVGFFNLIKSSGQAAEEIGHLGIQSGMTVQQIQALEVMLNRVNLGTQDLNMMIRTLSRSIVESQDETSKSAQRFRELNVSQEALKSGNLYSVIEQVSAGLRNYRTAQDQATVGAELMGRTVVRLLPLLLSEPDAFAKAAAESRKWGEMNEQTVKSLQQMDDLLDDLRGQFKRWGEVLSGELATAIKVLIINVVDLGKLFLEWAKESGTLFVVTAAFKLLGAVISTITFSLKGITYALEFVGKAMAHLLTLEPGKILGDWDEYTKRTGEAADELKKQWMALYPPDLEKQYKIVKPIGEVPRPGIAGGISAADADELKRQLAMRTAQAKAEYDLEKSKNISFQRESSFYYRFLDAQRNEDFNKVAGNAKERLRVENEYWAKRHDFETAHSKEQLDLYIKGLVAEGEQQEAFNQRMLNESKKHTEDLVVEEKAKNFSRLDIHNATLNAIGAAELAEAYKVRRNETELAEVHSHFQAQRLEEKRRYQLESAEIDDKIAADDYDRQTKLHTDMLTGEAAFAKQQYEQAKTIMAPQEARFQLAKVWIERERDLARDSATKTYEQRMADEMALDTQLLAITKEMTTERLQLEVDAAAKRLEAAQLHKVPLADEQAALVALNAKREELAAAQNASELARANARAASENALYQLNRGHQATLAAERTRDAELEFKRAVDANAPFEERLRLQERLLRARGEETILGAREPGVARVQVERDVIQQLATMQADELMKQQTRAQEFREEEKKAENEAIIARLEVRKRAAEQQVTDDREAGVAREQVERNYRAFLDVQLAEQFAEIKKQEDDHTLNHELGEVARLTASKKYASDWLHFQAAYAAEQQRLQIEGATAMFDQAYKKNINLRQQQKEMADANVTAATTEMVSLKELSDARVKALEAERNLKLAQLPREGDQTMARAAITKEYTSRINEEILVGQGDMIGGLKRGWYIYMNDLTNNFNYAVDFARRTADSMTQAFSSFFFDFMKGKIQDLESLWEGFRDFMYKIIADLIARLITLFIMRKVLEGASLFGGAGFGAAGGISSEIAWAKAGGLVIPKYQFGGPTFVNEDRYPAMLRRGEFVVSPQGVDAINKLNQGNSPFSGGGAQNISVNVINSGRTDKPVVNFRRQMEGMVLDIIFRNQAQNGPARGI